MSRSGVGDRVSLAAGIGLLLANRAALAVGLRRRIDGWRRAAGLVLREDAATFVLSAFGLRAGAGGRDGFAARLDEFLQREREFHIRVRRTPQADIAERTERASYTLGFEPMPPGPARFLPPVDWHGRDPRPDPRPPLLKFVVRFGDDGTADLWARVNHVGIDGVPAQELLSRIEAEWGMGPVVFPSAGSFAACEAARPLPGRPGQAEVQAFVDFGPLLAWRKRANAGIATPLTVSGALQWRLGMQELFAGRFMGSTVEVPAIGGLGRGVGVVVTRPSRFARRADGLAPFAADFAHQVELNRRRASSGCKTLDAGAFLPAGLCERLLRHALDHQPGAFGTLGLTILKDAKVFVTPLGDAGHADGFLAMGRLDLPSEDGGVVGCVTFKGPVERVSLYPGVLRSVIQGCVGAG